MSARFRLILISAVFLLLAAGMAFWLLRGAKPPVAPPTPPTPVVEEKPPLPVADSYALALARAKIWHTDAGLAYVDSGPIDERGVPVSLSYHFVSASAPGVALRVTVTRAGDIDESEVVSFTGTAQAFPDREIITPEQAVVQVKEMPEYQDAQIQSVEAVYGPGNQVWYWGVVTDKGTVSIEATAD